MSSKRRTAINRGLLWGLAITAFLLCLELPACAQTWTQIYSFNPYRGGPAGVTMDAAGNLYGTTAGAWLGAPTHFGTAYKLAHTDMGWVYTTLHIFNGVDGNGIATRAVFGPDGALYGTASYGGDGYGTVYRLQPPANCRSANCPWTATVLYTFHGGSDGWDPATGDLAFDQQGNVYGTTSKGGGTGCGSVGCGEVFKLTRSGGSWSYSVLYPFEGGDDGGNPSGGVVLDGSGNLYGTAELGPYRNGVVFKLAPSGEGWTKSLLYDFPNQSDGIDPLGGLVFDRDGNLYGTTPTDGGYGAGTIYELTPANGGWNFAVLASLQTLPGSGPEARLAIDDNGNLYGTAWSGLIFKLTYSNNNWTLTELFNGDLGMYTSVVVDSNGLIYGADPGYGNLIPASIFELTQ